MNQDGVGVGLIDVERHCRTQRTARVVVASVALEAWRIHGNYSVEKRATIARREGHGLCRRDGSKLIENSRFGDWDRAIWKVVYLSWRGRRVACGSATRQWKGVWRSARCREDKAS